jgi:hypothetical protein
MKVRIDRRTDGGLAKLIGVIRDYMKTPKTGFMEHAVLIRDLELAFSAILNTTGPNKTFRLLCEYVQ